MTRGFANGPFTPGFRRSGVNCYWWILLTTNGRTLPQTNMPVSIAFPCPDVLTRTLEKAYAPRRLIATR
jgi:hypothetical protein